MNLYPHQEKALEESKGLSRVAYYWDMGLGKTFIGSEKLSELGAGVNLVVCQKSKIRDWMDHFSAYYKNICMMRLRQVISPLPLKRRMR